MMQASNSGLPDYLYQAGMAYRLDRARAQGRRFSPLPWAVQAWDDHSLVLLLTGSAGGGKSRLAAEKLHRYLKQHAGASGLVLRKAREYTSKSVLPFLWHTVMEGEHTQITFNRSLGAFYYQNNSVLYSGGMQGEDQREALRSIGKTGGLDIIWMEEANAFTEDDFNELLARLRGTAGSYRQIVLTTNPDAPSHWINRRLIVGGEASVYYSHASDNPHNSPEYLETLNRMTGVLRERMVEGRWVQAAGAVYDNFYIERHVTADADYDPDREVVWGVDDGWTAGMGPGTASYHPRVILFVQTAPDGSLTVFDEYTATNELSERSIANARARPYRPPACAYVDSSASELRARLWQSGIQTVSASHRVIEGIKVVRSLLGDADHPPRLRIHPRCRETIQEFMTYSWRDQQMTGDPQPAKINDHAMDALRYAAYHLRHGT